MKLTTIALAIAFALPSTFALARGGISIGSQVAHPFGGTTLGAAGPFATPQDCGGESTIRPTALLSPPVL